MTNEIVPIQYGIVDLQTATALQDDNHDSRRPSQSFSMMIHPIEHLPISCFSLVLLGPPDKPNG